MDKPTWSPTESEAEALASLTLLFDFYAELLTPRQREVLHMHCNEDLSLAEIAQELQISRQAVHDAIQTGRALLERYEDKLKLAGRFTRQRELVEQVQQAVQEAQAQQTNETQHIMRQAVDRLLAELLEL